LLIVNNSYIFTGSNKKKQDTSYLEKYLDNPNPNTILIFTVNTDKLDSRKKIVDKMKNKYIVKEFSNSFDIKKNVLKMFEGYQISSENLNLFINRVGKQLYILNQEAQKLKTYKIDTKEITEDDILNVTHKTVDMDIFHLVENIILKRKKEALESYYEMIIAGEEPIKIIVLLANQFRLIYQVKKLSEKKHSIYDMMNILGQKKYPIEKALEKAKTFDEDSLLDALYQLAQLDINIKNGKIDKNIGLELFILEGKIS
jgi:DNA polymerase-3 subunit delta